MDLDSGALEELLAALGDHLQAAGAPASIVVVGGGAMAVMGWVDRTTDDVDVIARVRDDGDRSELLHPDPLPRPFVDAVARVARDYSLRPDWLNTEVAMQWSTELPPGLLEDLEWRHFGALRVGFAGRRPLVALKLYAAVDQGSESVHFQDLVALDPTDGELEVAGHWVTAQDGAPGFADAVAEEVANLRHALGRDRRPR